MFDTRFNNSFQSVDPNDPYAQYQNNPYSSANVDPNMMNNIPYPTPPTQIGAPQPQNLNPVGYARGGKVKAEKPMTQNKPYHILAEMIRQQGKGEDTVLAHINPLEAMMLKQMGGSGTINKETGLPQFGLFNNPKKWFKSVVGPAAGVVLGNMLLPGLGGMLGGALGGAAGSKIRGRKDAGAAALRGLGMGAAAPTLADLAGSGLSALGAPGTGAALTGYGENNAIMPALDRLLGLGGSKSELAAGAAMPAMFSANKSGSALQNYNRSNGLSGLSAGDDYEDEEDYGIKKKGKKSDANFLDKLLGNTGDYLSKPKNLLTLASAGTSLLNRPKKERPKTPEQFADEQKRLEKALMLTPSERAAREADLLAEARMQRSIARNKFLPEERLGNLDPLYRKSHTPEEQKRHGKWFSYYNNPNFTGEPLPFKEGGEMMYGAEEMAYPSMLGNYIMGDSKGQDDDVNAKLSNGEFVIPADIVADLGDGNNNAGANVLYELMNNVRKHKRGGKVKLPPKAKPVSSYLK